MNQLFKSIVMLCVILFAGCNNDKSTPEPEPEPITYSVTYTVNEISDDFFDLGAFLVSYADKDAKDQVLDIAKGQRLFTVTVKDLTEDSRLSFCLVYGYIKDVKLTKEKYTFQRNVSLTIKGSNGSMYSSTIISGGPIAMSKDKVIAYFDVMMEEDSFESTVKRFISKE